MSDLAESKMTKKEADIVKLPTTSEGPPPPVLLQQAIAAGNTELARDLMTLMRDWKQWQDEEKRQARADEYHQALTAAMAADTWPEWIVKDQDVKLDKGRGYKFENLAEVLKEINPALREHGLTLRFRPSTRVEGTQVIVKVSCILRHSNGFSEESEPLEAPYDTSGAKNQIQAVGSAITYLARYATRAFFGLAASTDDDGRSVDAPANPLISAQQVVELRRLLEEIKPGKVKGKPINLEDYEKMFLLRLDMVDITDLTELPQSKFNDAMQIIEEKRKSNG